MKAKESAAFSRSLADKGERKGEGDRENNSLRGYAGSFVAGEIWICFLGSDGRSESEHKLQGLITRTVCRRCEGLVRKPTRRGGGGYSVQTN